MPVKPIAERTKDHRGRVQVMVWIQPEPMALVERTQTSPLFRGTRQEFIELLQRDAERLGCEYAVAEQTDERAT